MSQSGVVVPFRLTASDPGVGDRFGNAVAIHGSTAVVGALEDDDRGAESGSAYVFERVGDEWVEVAKLTADDGATDGRFGTAVALRTDIAVVGADGHAGAGPFSGAVYVFERLQGQWVQTARLVATDSQRDLHFGGAVAIDGETLVVGAFGRDATGGAVYVFERGTAGYQQTAILTASDQFAGDYFGSAVSLDGDRLAVGAPVDADSTSGERTGSVYVFARRASGWVEAVELRAGDGAEGDLFGLSVSLDADTLAIGARNDDDSGQNSGSAYLFDQQNGRWLQQAKLVAPNGRAGDVFGHSLALSGNFVVVGAKWSDSTAATSGSAYLFERTGNSWKLDSQIDAPDSRAGDAFGQSAAIDGRRVLIGAWHGSAKRGAAYIFEYPSEVSPSRSTIALDESTISSFGGSTTALVTARSADGTRLGGGYRVRFESSVGAFVASVTDHGDGTYSQTLEVDGVPRSLGEVVISASVDGIRLDEPVTAALVPVSQTQSTVDLSPREAEAGEISMVTVTPKDGDGAIVGPGLSVEIEASLGQLVGAVVDNGDGTYTQGIRSEEVGTISILARVNGLVLHANTSLSVFAPGTLRAGNSKSVREDPRCSVAGINRDGAVRMYRSIQHAVDNARRHRLARILVAPGEYEEVIHVRFRSDLRIEAMSMFGLVKVRGIFLSRCRDVLISGFAVDPRPKQRAGILVRRSRRVGIIHCWLRGAVKLARSCAVVFHGSLREVDGRFVSPRRTARTPSTVTEMTGIR